MKKLITLIFLFAFFQSYSQDVILGRNGRYIPVANIAPILRSDSLQFILPNQRRFGDSVIYDIRDRNTNEVFTIYRTTSVGNTTLQDSDIDNVMIWKINGMFYVRGFVGPSSMARYTKDTSGNYDATPVFTRAINTSIIMKKDFYIDEGSYDIQGSIYVNKNIGTPMHIFSNGRLSKDYQGAKIDRGAVLFKSNSGSIFRVNLKVDGSPFRNFDSYSLNIAFSGFSMRGTNDTAHVVGIEGYRMRGKYENLGFVRMDYGILHNWVPPVGYVGTWNNYSDQSIFRDIRFMNMLKGGIKTTNNDAGIFESLYYEWPKYPAQYAIHIRNSYGFSIRNVLHSNGNNEMNVTDSSAFIFIEVSRAFSIEGIHAENMDFKNMIRLMTCFAWHIKDIHTRFRMRTMLSMYRCRAGSFEGWYDWTNTRTDTSDVDFRDEDPAVPTTDFTWNKLWLINFTSFAVREPKLNIPESATFGTYINRKGVEALIFDKFQRASYNYGTNPHFQMTNEVDLLELPQITEPTIVRLLNPALYPGRTLKIINRNQTTEFNTTLVNYLLWYADSTSSSQVPRNSTLYLVSDSTKWNVVSYMPGNFIDTDSSFYMTEYLNVNNNRFPKNGRLTIYVNLSANATLDLPSAAVTKGRTITVVKLDTTTNYVRAKSVVVGQLISRNADDTIRGATTSRVYQSDGTNYHITSYTGEAPTFFEVAMGRTRTFTSAASSLTLDNLFSDYIFIGTTATWTLPPLANNRGKVFWIKNKGSGNLTINSNAGGNDIYDGTAVNTKVIVANGSARIMHDGTNWVIW